MLKLSKSAASFSVSVFVELVSSVETRVPKCLFTIRPKLFRLRWLSKVRLVKIAKKDYSLFSAL